MISLVTLAIAILFIIVAIQSIILLYLWTANKASLHLIRVLSTTITPIHDWYKRVVSASWHETKSVSETVKEQMIEDK